MKKIKGCLWSAVAICLSAGVPLYGGDDDEKPAPTVRKTLKEIVALFPSKKEEPISDTRPRPCRIEERIPRFDAVATRFNEITQLFKSHIGCSDRILCGAVWERCYFISKQGKDETKEVLASFLFEGCEVGRVRTNVGYKRVRALTESVIPFVLNSLTKIATVTANLWFIKTPNCA